MELKETDFPCTYLDSDKASLTAQYFYKNSNWGILIVMLCCIIAVATSEHITSGIDHFEKIVGFFLLLTAIASTLLLIFKPERNWYVGRAIAESVKTLSWRFMMRSAPFNTANETADKNKFIKRVKEVADAGLMDGFNPKLRTVHSEVVTQKLIAIREMGYSDRKAFYAKHRIQDQIDWYTKKSKTNKILSTRFSIAIISCQLLATVYLIFFGDDFRDINLTEVLVFVATTLIAIMEMNKYKELHQSYLFTSMELNFIRNKFNTIQDDAELDEFVGESEQAISREHTMWLARRGNSAYLH